MANPVVASSTSNTATSTTLTLTTPSGVATGDLLIILCGSEDSTGFSSPPSGWTLINHASTTGVSTAAFWRIADGGEGSSTDVTQGSSVNAWGAYLRITGHDVSVPIDVVGSDITGSSSAGFWTVTAVTTAGADALALGAFTMTQGWTLNDITWSGTSWAKQQAIGSGFVGTWARRNMGAAGSTGNVLVFLPSSEDSDTGAGFQFAIAATNAISADPATVALTAVAGTVVLGSISVAPASAALALSAVDPFVVIGTTVVPDPAALSLTGVSPTVSIVLRVTPAAASVALTAIAPTVLVIRPAADLSLLAELRIAGAAELALRADLDVHTPETYRVILRDASTGVESVLGEGTSLEDVAIANGRYVLRVEADSRFWRGVRYSTEYAVTIRSGGVGVALPPIVGLAARILGTDLFVSWRVEPPAGTSNPEDFAVWVASTSPVDTTGAPTATASWAGVAAYLVELSASATTLYVAVRARLGATLGAVSEVAVTGEAEPDMESPSSPSGRIPNGDWF